MRHTISVLVKNEFGVLARVASLFSARGFNIESLSVAETLNPSFSIMTIVTEGDEQILEQITKQLNKLIDVIKVANLSTENFIEREMALIKVGAENANREELFRIVEIFKAKIVDVSPKTMTIEVSGNDKKLADFFELLKSFRIREIVRTGKIAMLRDKKRLKKGE
ncbi:MAG: acetolactate synthase small subunit [Deltaproteobacteria bacterium]|nr:acetolactate synthase small subunit [Deltaproteobacteria bacterium]RLA91783.1 MAG: acetolactate synthase small subunit [Deltaproteobacteria bacterium]